MGIGEGLLSLFLLSEKSFLGRDATEKFLDVIVFVEQRLRLVLLDNFYRMQFCVHAQR